MDKDVAEILEIYERVLGLDAEGTIKHLTRQRNELQARNVELVFIARDLAERLDKSEQMVALWRKATEDLLKMEYTFGQPA